MLGKESDNGNRNGILFHIQELNTLFIIYRDA